MADGQATFGPAALQAALAALTPAGSFTVAFSGGLDSFALLHALAALRDTGLSVDAVHVNHGLQVQSGDWAQHCHSVCDQLRVPLQTVRADAVARSGESPEAAARRARYAALADALGVGFELVTAHTLDDQAETLLLRLMRGCGVDGAAAMAARRKLSQGWLNRPLLDVSRAELLAYARTHRLTWIEDPSNDQLGYDRNFMRHRVLPLLRERWPATTRTLARDAGHFADARALLDEVARRDLESVGDGLELDVGRLRELPRARRQLVLRHWLQSRGLTLPGSELLSMLDALAREQAPRAQPEIAWRGGCVRRYRDRLYAHKRPGGPAPAVCAPVPWDAVSTLLLPGAGHALSGAVLDEMGVTLPPGRKVEVGLRRGGERFRPAGHAHHKSLKQLLRERGVPPWRRARIPLVYVDGVLAVVVGIAVAEGFQRRP